MNYELKLLDPKENNKLKSDDRVFTLSVIDEKLPLTYHGMVDKRLFTGENKLHAVKDPQYQLWYLKYEMGAVPEPLKQQFTSFKVLHKFCVEYFKKRNIEIKEVV